MLPLILVFPTQQAWLPLLEFQFAMEDTTIVIIIVADHTARNCIASYKQLNGIRSSLQNM